MRRGTTSPGPLPLDYAWPPERRAEGADGLTFHAAVSGLLVLGLGLFGGGLAALVTRSDGYGFLLAAGSVAGVVFFILRRQGK